MDMAQGPLDDLTEALTSARLSLSADSQLNSQGNALQLLKVTQLALEYVFCC